ncbi:Enhancer of zeste [Hyphodiscus hymeniophilus]|uniref:Enhancer of zeste n=1 Tax=Hyphodiscus hymeniophilus TaxID=353542 RepID=A0A9P6SN62_9HELO|nr:Enhancer of zeste [Hyphodiscus hymeniophilus]
MDPSGTFIDLTLDMYDNNEARLMQGRPQNNLIDLTEDSPPPQQRINIDTELRVPNPSLQSRRPVPIQSRASLNGPPKIERSPDPFPPVKFSPPSASRNPSQKAQIISTRDGEVNRSLRSPNEAIIHEVTDSEDGDDLEEEDRSTDQIPLEDLSTLKVENLPQDHDLPSNLSFEGSLSPQISFERSIGTDSPIAIRHRAKKAQKEPKNNQKSRPKSTRNSSPQPNLLTDEQSLNQQPNIVDLEERLEKFQQRVHDDHAETVKWLLHDARRAVAKENSPFIDDICPFAAMKAVNAIHGQTPDGMIKLKLDTVLNKKKLARSSTYLPTAKVASNVPRVPKYSSYTIVKRNILCADDEQLKFMPFLGVYDSKGDVKSSVFNRLVKELDEVYSAKRSGSSQETEMASTINTYIDGWLEELDLGLDRQGLISYILEENSDNLDKSQKEIKRLRKASGGPLAPHMVEIATTFSAAFKTVFNPISITSVILPDQRLKEMLERTNKPGQNSPLGRSQSGSPKSQLSEAEYTTERLGTYINLTCLICGAICCQTHGDYHREEIHSSDDSETNDSGEEPAEEYRYTHQPVALRYDEMLRKQDVRLSNPVASNPVPDSDGIPCSDECYRNFDHRDRAAELSREVLVALRSFMISMRPAIQPCNISFLLGIPCWQVYTKIQDLKSVVPNTPEPYPQRRFKVIDWYDNKRKILRSDWQEMTSAHLHQERTQANPCAHNGPCNGDCPCASSNILCEAFCGCPDDCLRKFTGCNCHASGSACVSESCICIAMNRECGSQCTSCGAVPRIDPKNKFDDDLFSRGCQNIVLQRGVDRKLMIGESQLEGVGFGLYLGEQVRKGDYLSEYTGEVISFAEADRRGIIYDRKYMSFLFDLNSEWCIDAARLGNKTRFINHAESEQNGLNCEAKIFLVNGEHRIKFVALRDIKAGEELLFNYGKKFAEKHGLNKRMPKAVKEGGKKGVVEGEEALEALDGNRARGKWTATRGGHGSGRGGRKATKSAPMKQMKPIKDLIAEVERAVQEDEDESMPDVDEAEEEDDDGEDEESVHERRRKRRIRRPKRYTR